MSEIMRVVDEIEALAEIESIAGDLEDFAKRAVDGRGVGIHTLREGIGLQTFAINTYKEATQRRFALQIYMLTLAPTSIEEATALLKLVFNLTDDQLLDDCQTALAERAFNSIIRFLDDTLPVERRGRLPSSMATSQDSWQADVADIKAAADKLLSPLAKPAPTSISN